MCGRFVSPEEATIERYWHLGRRNSPNPFARRFNVFPTDTAEASGALAEIHARAPVVLPESAPAAWLDRKLTDPQKVDAIAAARVPPDAFTHWKVRLLVNDTHLDGPELIEPAEEPVGKN